MTRERAIRIAVEQTRRFPDDAEAHSALTTPNDNPRLWRRADLEALFGREAIEQIVNAMPAVGMYLTEGITLSSAIIRQRLGEGGDLRTGLGADNANALLSLGYVTLWREITPDHDPPTLEEFTAERATQAAGEVLLTKAQDFAASMKDLYTQGLLTVETFTTGIEALTE